MLLAEWICAGPATDIAESGPGLRVDMPVPDAPRTEPAFVVRYQGELCAYLNRCGHVPVELDWPEGQFFDSEAVFLVCATHGAAYSPQTGACMVGPCAGRGLVRLQVRETDGQVWLRWPPASN